MNGPSTSEAVDMAPLIGSLRALTEPWQQACVQSGEMSVESFCQTSVHAAARELGLLPKGQGKPEVVLSGDVAVELGAPATASHSAVLMTQRSDLVWAGRVSRYGPDLKAAKKGTRVPFGQVILVQVGPHWPDPFSLDNARYLTHRLPGYMARSIPGRLWIRVSHAALARGLSLSRVGMALIASYLEQFAEVVSVEVIFATREDFVDSLSTLCLEAEVVAGRHRKLAVTADGDLDCAELSCDECEEKPVCDGLRDMLAHRRRAS